MNLIKLISIFTLVTTCCHGADILSQNCEIYISDVQKRIEKNNGRGGGYLHEITYLSFTLKVDPAKIDAQIKKVWFNSLRYGGVITPYSRNDAKTVKEVLHRERNKQNTWVISSIPINYDGFYNIHPQIVEGTFCVETDHDNYCLSEMIIDKDTTKDDFTECSI